MTLVKYTHIKIEENHEPMVDVTKLGLKVDSKYYEQGLSTSSRIFLRTETAKKLVRIDKKLGKLNLKIWDGFRNRDTQNNLYQKYWSELKTAHPNWPDEQLKIKVGTYVSLPYEKDRIPPHATGGTVDLTLIDEHGKELDMGTEFDHFGPLAAPFYFEIYQDKPEIAKNRQILREAMFNEGFTIDGEEWWHFDYGNQAWALKKGKFVAFYGEVNQGLFNN